MKFTLEKVEKGNAFLSLEEKKRQKVMQMILIIPMKCSMKCSMKCLGSWAWEWEWDGFDTDSQHHGFAHWLVDLTGCDWTD